MFRAHQLFIAPKLGYSNFPLGLVTDIKLIPVNIPEYWNMLVSKNTACLPSVPMANFAYACTFLDNYGQDLLTLLGILAVNIVISIVFWIASRTIKPKRGSSATGEAEQPVLVILKSVHEYYGISFTVLLLEVLKLEFLVFTTINVLNADWKNLNSILSISIGGSLVLYGFAAAGIGFLQGLRIKRVISHHSSSEPTSNSKRIHLQDSSNSKRSSHRGAKPTVNLAGLIRQATVNAGSPKESEIRLKQNLVRSNRRAEPPIKPSRRQSQVSQLTNDEQPEHFSESPKKLLSEIFPLSESNLRPFSAQFESAKISTNSWYVALTVVDHLQAVLLSLAVLLLSDYPIPQISVGLGVHAGYLLFIIKSNIKASRFEFGVDVSLRSVWIVLLTQNLIFTQFLSAEEDKTIIQYTPGAVT